VVPSLQRQSDVETDRLRQLLIGLLLLGGVILAISS
jgi:hypothetical protein